MMLAAGTRSFGRRCCKTPNFKGVPSIQPKASKTALSFHASKDPPEIRRDVMARLGTIQAKVFVAIRRKDGLAEEAGTNRASSTRKLTRRSLYADLVTRLFRNRLHQADRNKIVFAKHAKWTRCQAMALAI